MLTQLGHWSLVCAMLGTSGCLALHTAGRTSVDHDLAFQAFDATTDASIEGSELVLAAESGQEVRVPRHGKGWLWRHFVPGLYAVRVAAPGYVTATTPALIHLKPGVVWFRLAPGDSATEGPLVWSRITLPRLLGGSEPRCTELATAYGVRGTLVVKCVLDEAGQLKDCKVIQSLPHMEREVLRTLESRKYTPFMDGDTPIAKPFEVRINLTCG